MTDVDDEAVAAVFRAPVFLDAVFFDAVVVDGALPDFFDVGFFDTDFFDTDFFDAGFFDTGFFDTGFFLVTVAVFLDAGFEAEVVLPGDFLLGDFLARAFLTGVFLTGVFLAAVFLAAVFLAGVFLAGVFLAGVVLDADVFPADFVPADVVPEDVEGAFAPAFRVELPVGVFPEVFAGFTAEEPPRAVDRFVEFALDADAADRFFEPAEEAALLPGLLPRAVAFAKHPLPVGGYRTRYYQHRARSREGYAVSRVWSKG